MSAAPNIVCWVAVPPSREDLCVCVPPPAATMKLLQDIKQLAHPYHAINLVMSLSFLLAKYVPGLCELLFDPSQCGELSIVSLGGASGHRETN